MAGQKSFMNEGETHFTGAYPKRVEGSPALLASEVAARMAVHPQLDAREIIVEVSNSTVTLKGFVPDLHMVTLAESIVNSVDGIQQVENYLRVLASGATGSSSRTPGQSPYGGGHGTGGGGNENIYLSNPPRSAGKPGPVKGRGPSKPGPGKGTGSGGHGSPAGHGPGGGGNER